MGQPDPRWAEAPEFNWIPDQPFRAEIPPTANSNEPPNTAVRPEPVPPQFQRPPRPAAPRPAPTLELRQILKRKAGQWTDGKRRAAVLFGKLKSSGMRPARQIARPPAPRFGLRETVKRNTGPWIRDAKEAAARLSKLTRSLARSVPPAPRIEPKFEFQALLKPVAAEWAAGTERGADLLRETLDALGRAGDAMIGFFVRLWLLLRAASIAMASAIAVLAGGTARLGIAAGKSILVQISAPADSPASHLSIRLAVGALQGAGLMVLAAGHSMFVSALTMVFLFVPLLLLASFGRMPGKLLPSWTALAAAALAALGAYQYWRAPGETATAALMMAAIVLFIGQTLVIAGARDGNPLASYREYFHSAWSLAVQGVIWAVCAAVAALFADVLGNLLRQHYPGAHLLIPAAPLITLTVAFASWLLSPSLVRGLVQGLLAFLTLSLPVVTLFAISVAVAEPVLHWQPPLLPDMVLAALLLLAINASYGGGEDRPLWRQNMEFIASAALTPLVALGGFALHARVSQLGWTPPRIFAAAGLSVLGLYAVTYLVSAIVSVGGGRWMQRMERANLVIALAGLMLAAALASPLADPVRLAVQSQVQRVETAQVDPEAFDFRYLRQDGGRFGHDALVEMTALANAPDLARNAYIALAANPAETQPTPTQIGANIEVRGGQGRLPANLLARDWSKVAVPGVPPCLTSAALRCEAYFADLDGDGSDEIVLVYGTDANWWAAVMKQGRDGWYPAGTLASPCRGGLEALRAGRFAAVAPLPGWKDLLVGGTRLTVAVPHQAQPGCPR